MYTDVLLFTSVLQSLAQGACKYYDSGKSSNTNHNITSL